ncbi:MAG TPA: hypothetical protein VMT35_18125 [Ignavibacteriaceae bacterium]|nr:hypothetical protein [Ignavibacteriaceae bacterium]
MFKTNTAASEGVIPMNIGIFRTKRDSETISADAEIIQMLK